MILTLILLASLSLLLAFVAWAERREARYRVKTRVMREIRAESVDFGANLRVLGGGSRGPEFLAGPEGRERLPR